jgi:AraC-like DNA-binding protein
VGKLLAEARLPESILDDPETLIPERPLWLLAERGASTQGIDGFGFLVWESGGVETVDGLLSVLRQSPSPYNALSRFCEIVREESSDARFWLTAGANEIWFCREGIHQITVGRWEIEQYVLGVMAHIVQSLVGRNWQPAKVLLQAVETPGIEDCEMLSNAIVHVGQSLTAVAVSNSWLDRSLGSQSPNATAQFPKTLTIAEHSVIGFTESLQQALVPYVGSSCPPDIAVAAEIAGVSARTLQRRLADDGLSYSRLLDRLRFRASLPLLNEAGNSLTNIAYDLGYSDPAHFTRAFRRWSGMTPSAYRSNRENRMERP